MLTAAHHCCLNTEAVKNSQPDFLCSPSVLSGTGLAPPGLGIGLPLPGYLSLLSETFPFELDFCVRVQRVIFSETVREIILLAMESNLLRSSDLKY